LVELKIEQVLVPFDELRAHVPTGRPEALARSADQPAARLRGPAARAHPRHVLRPWQLVGDPHNDFANISIGDRQLALLLQLRGDCGDFLSGQPAG
jgi:hypothetical protein